MAKFEVDFIVFAGLVSHRWSKETKEMDFPSILNATKPVSYHLCIRYAHWWNYCLIFSSGSDQRSSAAPADTTPFRFCLQALFYITSNVDSRSTSETVMLVKFHISATSVLICFVEFVFYTLTGKDQLFGGHLHTNFRLKAEGEYISLKRPDGSTATTLDHKYPQQISSIAYGIPDYPSGTSRFTYLSKPTPGKPNAGVLDNAPFISEYGCALENHYSSRSGCACCP